MSEDRARVKAQRKLYRGAAMCVTDRDPPGYKESGQAIRFYEFELSAAEVALAELRADLAEMTKQRDAAMVFASRWLDGQSPRDFAATIREVLARRGYSQMRAAEMAGIAAALEALPAEIPDLMDAIDALYAHEAQPSGNSGGFAAASGILHGNAERY